MDNKRFILFVFCLSLSFFIINYYLFPQKIQPQKSILKTATKPIEIQPEIEKVQSSQDNFYVLENDSLQLVFSNRGGSLVGINLPFASENNKSIVRPIEIDEEVKKYAPKEDSFPVTGSYFLPGMKKSTAVTLDNYYPLIRRGQISSQYQSMSIFSDRSDLSNLIYQVTEFTNQKITFVAKQPTRTITKTFLLDSNAPYIFNVTIKIDGDSSNLFITSGILEAELSSGSPTYILKYYSKQGGKAQTTVLALPKETATYTSLGYDWVSISNGFFGLIIDPLDHIDSGLKVHFVPGNLVRSRITYIDNFYPTDKYPGYMLYAPTKTANFRVFAGPYQQSLLANIDQIYKSDYVQARTFQGWFKSISKPFSQLLFFILNLCHSFTHSWGISIILLTIFLKILLYPLNSWSIRSQLRMQEITPQINQIQAKYKKDPKKMQIEMMKLYRETGANPFMGCLPLLIQLPFLIGMFDLLRSTYELRGASFIPGWIDNLTAPDRLFCWGYHIPLLGSCFHLLPVLVALVTLLQQRMSSKLPKNTSEWTDQQRQQRGINNVMILVFLVLFYSFPSGMNIYWISSSLLGILQQWFASKYSKSISIKN